MLYGICIVLMVIWDLYILNGLRLMYRIDRSVYSKSFEERLIQHNDKHGLDIIYNLRSRSTKERFISMFKWTYLWGYYLLTENK